MAYIKLKNDELPGIVGLCDYRPETGDKLIALIDVLMRGPSTLSTGERELIAAYVAYTNGSKYCELSHAANAAENMNLTLNISHEFREGFPNLKISDKLRSLLDLASKVRDGISKASQDDIDQAKQRGATDIEIHDTVLISSLMCMAARYIENLGVEFPQENSVFYRMNAVKVTKSGYSRK